MSNRISREYDASLLRNRSMLACCQISSTLLAQSKAKTRSRSLSPSTWYAIWGSPSVYGIRGCIGAS